jgi:hypothetical protein
MKKRLIFAPWITATAAALYAIWNWNRLPARMAVTFFMGRVTGWQAKETFLLFALLLMFASLSLLTFLLSKPRRIRLYEGPLTDAAQDRRRLVRILFAGHMLICGLVLPLCLVHIVSWNLYYQMSPTVNPFGNGSSGSTTYCANPVIQACPESVGTTAAYGPTRVSSTNRPVKVVPSIPS